MPKHAKGPRLYLRRGRAHSRTGERLPDIYFIRDGSVERSTGCGPDRLPEAEEELRAYIAGKWAPQVAGPASRSDPSQVLVADVLALYAREVAPSKADPGFVAGNIVTLTAWWGGRTISDVKRSTCQAYAAFRQAQPDRRFKDPATAPRVSSETARRELEDLSAAIGHWHGEDTLTTRPAVWLPDKPESSRNALTRSQAARMLRGALGHRIGAEGRWSRLGPSARANRAHLRRFILIGLYTGTRPGVIPKVLWEESATHPWADLDAGVIYRRGRTVREKRTKRTPVVKIPPRLLAHMRRWRRMDQAADAARREADPDAAPILSVLHHGGRPISGKIRTGFAGAVADGGLDPDITPHWMRHSAATWLMEAGVDVWKAAGYLGMNPATLIDHYGHHRPDYQAEAARGAGGRAR